MAGDYSKTHDEDASRCHQEDALPFAAETISKSIHGSEATRADLTCFTIQRLLDQVVTALALYHVGLKSSSDHRAFLC